MDDTLLYPRATDSNGYWMKVAPGDWTSGFFPGCLWYGYELTGDTAFRNAAERWTAGLAGQQVNVHTHDVGFIMFDSYGNGYRIHPNAEYKNILLRSAQSLATRFNPKVGCIRSWDNRKWQFPVIIDNMMNLELLFWASKNGGGQDLYDIAFSHALKTMEHHFRSDGSTYHVVDYDSATGRVLSRETHQGYADESVWARGQAWAIYGFTMSYRETRDPQFLQTAEKAAAYFIGHLPTDGIPYWDFLVPNIERQPRDVSAAAIAASALIELSTYTKNSENKGAYESATKKILSSLCQPPYLAEGTTSSGILNHAVGNYPAHSEIDVSLIYADYYFLESLRRYQRMTLQ